MSAQAWLDEHERELVGAVGSLRAGAATVESWGRRLADKLLAGSRLLAAGNGGSAAEAQHLTSELVGRFLAERRPFSAISLCSESSSVTAIVNDYGIDEMFARQVEGHGRPGDVLVLLSTSGRSPNVLRAAERGRELGLEVWGLTGPGPNPLAARCHQALCIDAPSTAAVQAAHLVAIHALCATLDERLGVRPGARPALPEVRVGHPLGEGATGRAQSDGPSAGRPGPGPANGRRDAGPAPVRRAGGDDRHRRPHVVVVGDVVLDADVDGRVERLSPDAPVPVVDVTATRESPGGAGLAALLCAASGARVTLVAPVADDAWGDRLGAQLGEDVTVLRLPHEGATRRKTRIRSAGQSLVRVDDGGPGAPVDVPRAAVAAALGDADAVLVSDYGAGTTRHPVLRDLLAAAAAERPVVWDPHPRGGPAVPRCALVTPNLAEARAALADAAPAGAAPDELATALRTAWDVRAACVTAGAAGAFLAGGAEPVFVPAPAVHGGDTCGAGDRFAASAVVALALGALLTEAVEQAVADASAWVAAGGAEAFRTRRAGTPGGAPAAAGPRPLGPGGGAGPAGVAPADAGPEPGDRHGPGEQPSPQPSLRQLAARLRADGGTLVATGGCFDIVHAGHVATLQAARRLGDHLVVLMNSDASVTRLKGPGRPVVTAADRARVLEALDCVDAVVVFDEDDPRRALGELRPDVWAKGGDYGGAPLPEAEVVREHGGRVVLLPYLGGRSTTTIIQRSALARTPAPRGGHA
ncbi:PfkB family carbohydrate kinase [Georgenia sp. AZ-5]|uniref:PfkB family carbohydrate kinase n=1 Tax=Georgenia sp. AZ-5 TaxID=3367526 RepID=UPI0037545255